MALQFIPLPRELLAVAVAALLATTGANLASAQSGSDLFRRERPIVVPPDGEAARRGQRQVQTRDQARPPGFEAVTPSAPPPPPGGSTAPAAPPRYRSGAEKVLVDAPVQFTCSDDTAAPFDRYFVALHARDENSLRALTFSDLSAGWRVDERGYVMRGPGGRPPTVNRVYGSLLIVGYSSTNSRVFPPLPDIPGTGSISTETSPRYRFDCSGGTEASGGPDLFVTVSIQDPSGAAGWQGRLIREFNERKQAKLFYPLAMVDGVPSSLDVPRDGGPVSVGRLLSEYLFKFRQAGFSPEGFARPVRMLVPLSPALPVEMRPRPVATAGDTQPPDAPALRDVAPPPRAPASGPAPPPPAQPAPFASARDEVAVTVSFSAADLPFLVGDNNPREYLFSPNCSRDPAVDLGRGQYRFLRCVLTGERKTIWVSVRGFEPRLLDVSQGQRGLDVAMPELAVANGTTALPEPDTGISQPYPIRGRLADLVQVPPRVSGQSPPGCEPQVPVTARFVFLDQLRIVRGPCRIVSIPVAAAFDPRTIGGDRYPRIVAGCLGQRGPVAAAGSALSCLIPETGDPELAVEWAPGLRPFTIKSSEAGAGFDVARRLVLKLPAEIDPRAVRLPGGAAPVYELTRLVADAPRCDRALQSGEASRLPSLADMRCPGLPRQIKLTFGQSAAQDRNAPPPAAFMPEVSTTLDIAVEGRPPTLPSAEDAKRLLRVDLAGDMRSPDFSRRAGSMTLAQNGDCASGRTSGIAQGREARVKWPAKAVLLTMDYKELTPCTEGLVRADRPSGDPVLEFPFRSLVAPGDRAVLVWVPSSRLQPAFPRIQQRLQELIASVAQDRERRYRFDVLVGADQGNLRLLFSGETAAGDPDVARGAVVGLRSDSPPVPELQQLEQKLEGRQNDVASLILVMDGEDQRDTAQPSRWANLVRARTPGQLPAGQPIPFQLFTRRSCDVWTGPLYLLDPKKGTCDNLDGRDGLAKLEAAILSLKYFK